MTLMISQVIVLSLAWLAYFIGHSVLASLTFKAWCVSRWPALDRYYRLLFNAFALFSLLPILLLLVVWQGQPLWHWQGAWAWLIHGLALTALCGFFWTLKYYDGGEFLGFQQLREFSADEPQEGSFVLSPIHRYVRHPWYFLALVLIWTREMDLAFLISAILMTGYFILGSRFEERKLVAQLGAPYAHYQSQVAGILPLPWKVLSKPEALQVRAMAVSQGRAKKKLRK